jgi:hypothetical protein
MPGVKTPFLENIDGLIFVTLKAWAELWARSLGPPVDYGSNLEAHWALVGAQWAPNSTNILRI